jgi:hypothetical protein
VICLGTALSSIPVSILIGGGTNASEEALDDLSSTMLSVLIIMLL